MSKRDCQHHPCKDCGKLCHKTATRCKSCAAKFRIRLHPMHHPKGDKSPAWKGGKYKNNGYIYLYKPDNPRSDKRGCIAEHTWVWEQTHRRLLPQGWVIHHLNGIKDDNRPSNLKALPNKKHYLVLQAKAKRIQKLESMCENQH